MTRNRVASHALRLPLIIALTAGMIGCIGITIVTLLPARLLWIALERVVERYWEDDWQRWQLFKADLHKRS